MSKLLIVDDEIYVQDGLRRILCKYELFFANNGVEALQKYEQIKPDLVIMDLNMPKMDGMAAIDELLKRHPEAAIIVLTGFNYTKQMILENPSLVQENLQKVKVFLDKPVDSEVLIENIEHYLINWDQK